jgi:hypothetical protein
MVSYGGIVLRRCRISELVFERLRQSSTCPRARSAWMIQVDGLSAARGSGRPQSRPGRMTRHSPKARIWATRARCRDLGIWGPPREAPSLQAGVRPSVAGKRCPRTLAKGNLIATTTKQQHHAASSVGGKMARPRAPLWNPLPARWKPAFRLFAGQCRPRSGRRFPPAFSPISTIAFTARRGSTRRGLEVTELSDFYPTHFRPLIPLSRQLAPIRMLTFESAGRPMPLPDTAVQSMQELRVK